MWIFYDLTAGPSAISNDDKTYNNFAHQPTINDIETRQLYMSFKNLWHKNRLVNDFRTK